VDMTRKDFVRGATRGAAGAFVASAIGVDLGAARQTKATRQPRKDERAAITGATEAIANFIAHASLAAMPLDVIEQGRRCLVDGFGVILAGSTVRGSAIIRDYVRVATDRAEATLLGTGGLKSSAACAALANGASGHAMDFDDTQLSTTPDRTYGLLTHPTVPALSAALAVAEREHASGAAFLEAFLVGVEVECKIAEAIDPDHYLRGFHTSGTVGTFGAAAAAAKLLKLDAPAIGHMLAIASSLASGIRVNFGSMTKPLHVARASEAGVFAADIAAKGFTGGAHGLDGEWGFFQVLGGGADLDRLIPVLGKPYAIVSPGVSVKPYPCGVLSHPSMDAMLKLVVEHDLKADEVKAIRLRAGSNILEPLRYKTATTELEAKFCLPFLLSAILLRRRAGVQEFTDAFVSSGPVQDAMRRVTNVFDPQIEKQGFEKIRSVVEIDLVDGRMLKQASDDRYRGGPDRPFTRQELHDKFADCARLTLPADGIDRALRLIDGVSTLKAVNELTENL
jgi:2-methylcitrate dehydratase PrpD